MRETIKELEELLYSKLKDSPNGELSFYEIIDIFDSKADYGLRKVNGGAIKIIQERHDVEQLRDDKGRLYFKHIRQ